MFIVNRITEHEQVKLNEATRPDVNYIKRIGPGYKQVVSRFR